MNTVLVPLDGSQLARRALPYAAWLARAEGAALLLIHAALDIDETKVAHAELLPALQAREVIDRLEAVAELETVAEQMREQDVSVDTLVRPGNAARVILETANLRDVGLIMMSTHGRGGLSRWLYGSVADQVLRQARQPVVLVPPACEISWPTDRPLRVPVCLDGSELAGEALIPARHLATRYKAALILVRVAEPPFSRAYHDASKLFAFETMAELATARRYLDSTAGRLRAADYAVATRSGEGDAVSGIISIVAEKRVDLIAMATHGRGGLARAVLGSVATAVLQRATVPLLLVRPATLRARDDVRSSEPFVAGVVTSQGVSILADSRPRVD